MVSVAVVGANCTFVFVGKLQDVTENNIYQDIDIFRVSSMPIYQQD